MPEKFSAMRNLSDDLFRSPDSLSENQDLLSLEQSNYRKKQQKLQSKSRENIDNLEHEKADVDLKNELSTFGISMKENEVIMTKNDILETNKELSIEDKIKNYTETIKNKSQVEILRLLIAKFENKKGIETLIGNFRNFLKLHQLAENKPPQERKAIENIIAKADFTSENAFVTSLTEISQSSEISNATKLEILREFNGAKVFSVNDLDNGLKQQQTRKNEIESAINSKSREKTALSSDIDNLKDELEKLPLNDPKRQKLEEKIEQKKEVLKQTKSDIVTLEKAKPKDISFPLRNGFSAKLNDDGTRSIKINSADFTIKLPNNFLPFFTDTKNLQSINLTFPYLALKNQKIANIIFSPNLENNSVPTKRNRDMSHLILSTLKIDDSQILSENDILQLNKDLSRLTALKNGKSSKEKLIDLGVFDIDSQSLDKLKFREILKFILENRGLDDDLFFEKINELLSI